MLESKQEYRSMELVTPRDYGEFVRQNHEVQIEDTKVQIGKAWDIQSFGPPKDYTYETETVWSFPNRGDWATHEGNYRGNWSPYIPRNLIQRYTQTSDLVLDQMCGSGTTLVECKLLGRNAIGVDINRDAMMVTLDRLHFPFKPLDSNYPPNLSIETYIGDARKLNAVNDESIDLIATHPPYAYIIPYGKRIEGDLSALRNIGDFLQAMRAVADECYRVLKAGRHCAILIGDTRRHKHYVPISYRVLQQFLESGFVLREDIIKRQWKTKTTREAWRSSKLDFYKIAHEHLYVFRKPSSDEDRRALRSSAKWW
jgi:SAM-dependent methyltransferase